MEKVDIVGENYLGHYKQTRCASRAIIIKDDMILLSYEKNNDLYMVPGGGLEENETAKECAIREVEEETGFIIHVNDCLLEIDEYYEENKYITKYFAGSIIDKGVIKLTPGEALDGMEPRWIKVNDAISKFANFEKIKDHNEMHGGLYFREYTALKKILN